MTLKGLVGLRLALASKNLLSGLPASILTCMLTLPDDFCDVSSRCFFTVVNSDLIELFAGSIFKASSKSEGLKVRVTCGHNTHHIDTPLSASEKISRAALACARRKRALTFLPSKLKTVVQSLSASRNLCSQSTPRSSAECKKRFTHSLAKLQVSCCSVEWISGFCAVRDYCCRIVTDSVCPVP